MLIAWTSRPAWGTETWQTGWIYNALKTQFCVMTLFFSFLVYNVLSRISFNSVAGSFLSSPQSTGLQGKTAEKGRRKWFTGTSEGQRKRKKKVLILPNRNKLWNSVPHCAHHVSTGQRGQPCQGEILTTRDKSPPTSLTACRVTFVSSAWAASWASNRAICSWSW